MGLLKRIFRKIFLVKEIISKEGAVHFRRYRLLQTPWFAFYIHQILRSDMDADPHDHPWNFSSLILSGSYIERCRLAPFFDKMYVQQFYQGDVIKHKAEDAHQLSLQSKEVWTLVFTSGRSRVWGYQTKNGWVDFKTYREMKNSSSLD